MKTNKSEVIIVRVEPDIRARLERIATNEGVSMSVVIRRLLSQVAIGKVDSATGVITGNEAAMWVRDFNERATRARGRIEDGKAILDGRK